MANNFSDAQVTISNANLTDVVTASNRTLVIDGTMANTGGTSINVTLKKVDSSAGATFTILNEIPLPSGSTLSVPKILLQSSDKIQAQSSSSSGLLTVALNLLTDVA